MGEGQPRTAIIRLKPTEDLACAAICGFATCGVLPDRRGYKFPAMAFASTVTLRREIGARIPERPFSVEFWDGTRLAATNGGGPTFYVRSPPAARHGLPAPGQLGLGRAYVSGEIEIDDIDAVIELLDGWQPPALEGAGKARLLLGALRAAGLTRPPPRPAAELRPSGHRHSKERDAEAVRHHYDVSMRFFLLSVASAATSRRGLFLRGGQSMEVPRAERLELSARKSARKTGGRVAAAGCGWGRSPIWGAPRHGAS